MDFLGKYIDKLFLIIIWLVFIVIDIFSVDLLNGNWFVWYYIEYREPYWKSLFVGKNPRVRPFKMKRQPVFSYYSFSYCLSSIFHWNHCYCYRIIHFKFFGRGYYETDNSWIHWYSHIDMRSWNSSVPKCTNIIVMQFYWMTSYVLIT